MKFSELNVSQNIKDAIAKMEFDTMTQIQRESIPFLLEGKDLIGQSQTGSGKTLAFAIPTVEKIDLKNNTPQALIMCPTRELALQVSEEFKKLARFQRRLKIATVYGGESIVKQIRELKRGSHIVVGTPGRLIDHINRKTFKPETVSTVILDEADEMLNMGFREDIESILNVTNPERQTILFSATMPDRILDIANKYQDNPVKVKISRKTVTTDSIDQFYFNIKRQFKFDLLNRLIECSESKLSLIFCNTKRQVDILADMLLSNGYNCNRIHGDMKQSLRLKVLSDFNQGKINILIATDVAARGIDINDIDVVYNYDIPENEENYVHRIGRTGRAGRKGTSYSFITKSDGYNLKKIERYIKKKITKGEIPSVDDINQKKINQFIEDLHPKFDNAKLDKYKTIISENFQDYPLEDVAALLLSMHLKLEKDNGKSMTFNSRDSKEPRGAGRKSGRNQRDGNRDSNSDRIYLNVGYKQKIDAKKILRFLIDNSKISFEKIGKIDIYEKFTFVNIPEQYSKTVVKKTNNQKLDGNKVRVELSRKKK